MKNVVFLSYDRQRETGKVEGQRKDLHINNCVSIEQFSMSPNNKLIKGSFVEVK